MTMMQRALKIWLLFLIVHSKLVSGSTLLRTAVISRKASYELDWLGNTERRRQLLGHHECHNERWGPLRGRMQMLLQLADGVTVQEVDRLTLQLHGAGAIISSSLPENTWLVLAPADSMRAAAYHPHTLVPYSPELKLAPEWHPVLEAVQQQQQQQQQHASSDSDHHMQVHQRILAHQALRHLKITDAAASPSTAPDASSTPQLQAPGKVLIGVHFAEVPQTELLRLGVQQAGFHPAGAAAEDWAESLQTVTASSDRSHSHKQQCQPVLTASSPSELDVAVCPQDLSEVLYWLSNQAVVHWLAPRSRLYFQNSLASVIIQSSTMKTAVDYKTLESRTFWDAGLDGKNQIIGIGDSGIDMHSCFFSDPQVPFVQPTAPTTEWANDQHRKVVYYWGLADEHFRDLVGHGTHTAGSVAGFNPAAPDSKATGAAKAARLAFVDLSRTAGGDVNAPQDLEQNYFPKMYARGACVFTDSWGSTSPVYDFQASKLDMWLYKNQDCISHFAAGNYGENDNLDSTITSPATAKNVVTVGATKSAAANYVSQTIAPVFMMSVEIRRANKAPQYVGVRVVKADFGGDGVSLSNLGLRLVRASPDTACGALEGAASGAYTNAIVLARRGSCYFSQKLAAGTAAGAAAVVVINDKAGGYFKMDATDMPATASGIPLFAITRRIGEQLWSFFDNANMLAATIERYAQGWPAYEDIASFSSFGPTNDGRIKPDIVAPGELVSAASADADPVHANTGTCNVGRKSGTSMATPMAAGHTAIIRQYFMDGFYPSGARGNAPYLPSGPLMKGVMLGGACDMQGNTEQYLPLEDSPSMRQGFGRFCLCNALKLLNNCTTNLQFVDRVPIVSQDTHKYCLRTVGGGDVRVTLSWYDYPAQVSAEKTLVNDLDLAVTSGGMGGQSFFGNMNLKKDSVNTVERVWLRNVPAGGLEITVTAGLLSPQTKSQNYSLVVQGAFIDTLNSPYNPDPAAAKTPSGCSAAVMAAGAPAEASAAIAPAAQPTAQPAAAPASVVEEKGASAATAAAALTSSAVAAASSAAAQGPATAPAPATPAPAPSTPPPPTPTPAAPLPAPTVSTPAPTVPTPVAAPDPAAASATVSPAAAAAAAATQPAAAAALPAVAATPVPAAPVPAPVNTADQSSLVNTLVSAMTVARAQTQSVSGSTIPAATGQATLAAAAPAQGRRLTWTGMPIMPAWVGDTDLSAAIKVPLLVCRWINATARKAASAAMQPAASQGGEGLGVVQSPGDATQQHSAGDTAAAVGHLRHVPLQHLLLAAATLLICVAAMALNAHRHRLHRGISLTSAVRKDMSLNKAIGRAPTGEAALLQALLDDPSLAQQISPSKRAHLAATSPFGAPARLSSASSIEHSARHSSEPSDTWTPAAVAAGLAAMPHADALRVHLAVHSASEAAGRLRPWSVQVASLPCARSMPATTSHSAPITPCNTAEAPATADGSTALGSHLDGCGCLAAMSPTADVPRLQVLAQGKPVSRLSDSMLPTGVTSFSQRGDGFSSPEQLRRCSHSFTFGNTAAAAPVADTDHPCAGGLEVFGLSARQPLSPVLDVAMQRQRAASLQEALTPHTRAAFSVPQVPGAVERERQAYGDADVQRDQQ